MRFSHALLARSLLLAALLLVTAPAGARSAVQAKDAQATTPETSETGADALATGSVSVSPAEERKRDFADCMAIWEPATHMTRRQWRRTCKRQLDEIPGL